jgi:hypothetical protein
MEAPRPPALDELAAVVEARAAGKSPASRLQTAIEVGHELTDTCDDLIGRFVAQARDAGLSWTEIGQLFGTSKQAAQQRYGAAATSDPGAWPGRWSRTARDALNRAGEEARALGHDYIGTEHALVALTNGERGIAGDVLADLGVSRERILATPCIQPRPRDEDPSDCMSVMPRLKQALEHSRRISKGLGVHVADTEHLLAGIVAVPDSMAVEILRRLRVRPAAVHAKLAERLEVDPLRLGASRRRRRGLVATARRGRTRN